MKSSFGLSQKTISSIQSVLQKHENIQKAVIYGSRAKGNYREGSDIDLTLYGYISFKNFSTILDEIDDLLLPYTIDLSVYENLKNVKLKEHIDRVGQVFYEKKNL